MKRSRSKNRPTVVELCAGGGGQAIGLHDAGFTSLALVEWNEVACQTLLTNRPDWPVVHGDLRSFDASVFSGEDVTLVAGGVPCQPFTIAGDQLGHTDERDMFPEAVRIVGQCMPRAFLFENVAPLATEKFDYYRNAIIWAFEQLGYYVEFGVVNAAHYEVPQERRRFIMVGRNNGPAPFPWPKPKSIVKSVGQALGDLMALRSWPGAELWAKQARGIAPTIVGGSDRHGGPDLGPTRAKRMWAAMRVDGMGVADLPPSAQFPEHGSPRLTVRMAARIQGFPDRWEFAGRKTAAYRQVGNAFPPPVAKELGLAVLKWIEMPATKGTEQPKQMGPAVERAIAITTMAYEAVQAQHAAEKGASRDGDYPSRPVGFPD